MLKSYLKSRLALLVMLGALYLTPSQAEAKVPFLITYGDSISQLAPLPSDKKETLEKITQPGTQVGYKYSYFGLFFLDLWTWGGEYCLFKDKSFWSLKPEQAADLLSVPVDKLPKPLFYRFPSLLSLLVLGILALVIIGRLVKSDEEQAAELLKDERYREALELFRKKYGETTAAATPAAAAAGTPPAAEGAAAAEASNAADAEGEEAESAEPNSAAMSAALDVGAAHLISKGIKAEDAKTKLALLARVEIFSKEPAASASPST